jgi:hypothetical protein
LAWSGDGEWLAFTVTGGPPPGEVRVVAVRMKGKEIVDLAGMSFTWSGSALVVADPASSRVYLRDLELGVEPPVCEISDDGDPHFPPVISVSPDHRRMAVVTRRVGEGVTRVQLALHEGRTWEARPLTEAPGTALRIYPFWTADSAAMALFVIDLEQGHSSIIAIPERGEQGEVLYTSDSLDSAITPAVHPDGRLIAMVRRHPRDAAGTQTEERLVLVDPVEHAVAPITPDGRVVGQLRWVDDRTLLVEGRGIWTVRLRAKEEAPEAEKDDGTTRWVVREEEAAVSIACRVPKDWARVSLPVEEADFGDPRVMRPVCVFAPNYAAMVFTIAARPAIEGMTPEAMLRFLGEAQGVELGNVSAARVTWGEAVEATGTQEEMRLRLAVTERAGWVYAITVGAPGALWAGVKTMLDRIVESVEFLE